MGCCRGRNPSVTPSFIPPILKNLHNVSCKVQQHCVAWSVIAWQQFECCWAFLFLPPDENNPQKHSSQRERFSSWLPALHPLFSPGADSALSIHLSEKTVPVVTFFLAFSRREKLKAHLWASSEVSVRLNGSGIAPSITKSAKLHPAVRHGN